MGKKLRTTLSPESYGCEAVFAGPPTDAEAEARTPVTDRDVPARGSLGGEHPPVGVVLGVETSGRRPLEPDLRGATSPQIPFLLAPLLRRAWEQAGPVPWQFVSHRYHRALEATAVHTARQSACCRDSTYRR